MKQVIPGAYLEKNCLLIVLQHRWVFSFNRCGNVKLREVKKTQDLRSHSYLVVKPLLCLLSLFHGELSAKPSECGGSLPEFGTHAVFSLFMFFPHLGTTLSTKTTKTTQVVKFGWKYRAPCHKMGEMALHHIITLHFKCSNFTLGS